MERPCPCTVKDLSPKNLISIRVDALMQHRFERRLRWQQGFGAALTQSVQASSPPIQCGGFLFCSCWAPRVAAVAALQGDAAFGGRARPQIWRPIAARTFSQGPAGYCSQLKSSGFVVAPGLRLQRARALERSRGESAADSVAPIGLSSFDGQFDYDRIVHW
jgi:hypothetical protein